MEGLGLLLVLWIISTVFEKIRDAQRRLPPDEARGPGRLPGPPSGDTARPGPGRRGRLPKAGRRPQAAPVPAPAESGEDEWRKELERIFGIPGQTGPVGRRGDVPIPPAEEVEEVESLETEPELINVDEVALEQPARATYDQDEGAEALVQRRVAEAEARSRGLTKADHARFDKMIRPAPAAVDRTAVAPRRLSVRQAFVWKEILDPPVGLRRPE